MSNAPTLNWPQSNENEEGAAAGGAPVAPPRTELSDVVAEALVGRARQILSGALTPQPLTVPPEVDAFVAEQVAGRSPPPTAAALRRITERLALQTYYKGRAVAYHRSADGTLAVLACGGSEIDALLRGLSAEEVARVAITDTSF